MPEKTITMPLYMQRQYAKLVMAHLKAQGMKAPKGFNPLAVKSLSPGPRTKKNPQGDDRYTSEFKKKMHQLCSEAYLHSITPGGGPGSNPRKAQLSKSTAETASPELMILTKIAASHDQKANPNEQVRQLKARLSFFANMLLENVWKFNSHKDFNTHATNKLLIEQGVTNKEDQQRARLTAAENEYYRIFAQVLVASLIEKAITRTSKESVRRYLENNFIFDPNRKIVSGDVKAGGAQGSLFAEMADLGIVSPGSKLGELTKAENKAAFAKKLKSRFDALFVNADFGTLAQQK